MATAARSAFVVFLPWLLACATVGGLRTEPLEAGAYRAYRAPLNEVVMATRQAMAGSGIQVEEAPQIDEHTWMIIGKKGMSFASYGELVRAVVREQPDGQVSVRVVTKKKMATTVFAKGDWSQALFDQIALQLKQ
jgi:hypothetical protein